MKKIIFFIFFGLIFSSSAFSDNLSYVVVIDENSNPVSAYAIVPTQREEIFMSKVEPLKKWIMISKSRLIVVKNGVGYPVNDSLIFDKKKGIVLLLIDTNQGKPFNFNTEMAERDVNVLLENKKIVSSKLETLIPQYKKPSTELHEISIPEIDYLSIASKYENIGQLEKALDIYEQIYKKAPDSKESREILEKIVKLSYKLGYYKKAKDYLLKLPNEEKNTIKLASIYIIEKDFEGALKVIGNSQSNSAYLHYLKGILFYLSNKKDDAYRELSILLKLDKNLANNLRELLR
ncbi:tetratricopeptide repeat protein [Thermodesulfovibrio hydrogeniphilus]